MTLDIGSVAEAAHLFGVSKQVVVNWSKRYPHFPKPIARLAMGPIWDMAELRRWYSRHKAT